MPLFKKKKKEDPVRTAKKAEFSGKAKEALQEKDTAPFPDRTGDHTAGKEKSDRLVHGYEGAQ